MINRAKKLIAVLTVFSQILLCSCYDAGDVEETSYLIALGIDKVKSDDTKGTGFSYTFQLAAPLKSSGGGEETGGEGGEDEKKNTESDDKKERIYDSKNPTVNNIVIAAPDFYTAKNMLANYMSKKLNMSHLKMIVCARDVAIDSFKEHSELFSREREIRPGTFLCVSEGRAEAFLKAVNPELEGNTAKYYELVNSDKTLVYAPVKRLGDFSNDSAILDKSAVLPLARLSEAEASSELKVADAKSGRLVKSSISRISGAKPELWGMAFFSDGKLIAETDGTMALMYNILTGHTKQLVFSVTSPFDESDSLTFKCKIEGKPSISVQDEADSSPKIFVQVNAFTEYMGARLPNGYKSFSELNNTARSALEKEIESFMIETAQKYNADVLKTGRLVKKNYLTEKSFDNISWQKKYKNADFSVKVFLTDNGVSMF